MACEVGRREQSAKIVLTETQAKQRDGNSDDEAMQRRYERRHGRFSQPDPYSGSYDLADPQSFNRYSYVQNDPVNFTDPSGLQADAVNQGITEARNALQNVLLGVSTLTT